MLPLPRREEAVAFRSPTASAFAAPRVTPAPVFTAPARPIPSTPPAPEPIVPVARPAQTAIEPEPVFPPRSSAPRPRPSRPPG